MLENDIVVFRGGGDVATGSIQKLYRTGFKVLVLEMEKPLCIRRYVSCAQAIFDGEIQIEDFIAKKVTNIDEIKECWKDGKVPVYIDPKAEIIKKLKPMALVDGTLAKKNIGTNKQMADITIALGPGYEAGIDVDVVIETNRGHDLGRLIFEGNAQKNTGIPGNINGYTTERILRSPDDGEIEVIKDIGSIVKKGEVLACVNDKEVRSELDGMVRGMIGNKSKVTKDLKIGDVDPRVNKRNTKTISDKARLIGGGTLEAILICKRRIEDGFRNS
ncbi:EF2563 family selenium-dependent molybdenum hydroxylase system protein [Anaerococcus sp. AGMB00486]|uniref:EF2563 family selenium-dependent molybdenum hydroxylase system protein n=1 Tax=Anaerococcus faecalis TaxID=2742993 RepID=A0ABX2NC63_9FIRM|nr:selenium-dependent molybdenum cofactor biosynthesis protein YqeB [Anaerococcus faecalis]NVF12309.1 EF2563 family selenium-dependent molybdenum hydroxylase system protein [Anaerococcus faecalis]